MKAFIEIVALAAVAMVFAFLLGPLFIGLFAGWEAHMLQTGFERGWEIATWTLQK